MSTNRIFRNISSLILVLVAVWMLTGCKAAQNIARSTKIRATADQIASYSVPEGYTEKFAIDALGYQVVSLEGPTENCHIYLLQAPKNMEADFEKMLEQARPNGSETISDVHTVETRSATVRGKAVDMVVSEGINSEDQPYRSISLMFDGRGGPAMVSISSPNDLWDWDMVNTFLASIQ